MTCRTALLTGCFFGFLSVVLGAFGAHALKHHLSAGDLTIFETAVRYQMFHALALLAAGLGDSRGDPKKLGLASLAFAAGILIFSGSLYALVFSGVRGWGAVTPAGGLLLMTGWVLMGAAFAKGSKA